MDKARTIRTADRSEVVTRDTRHGMPYAVAAERCDGWSGSGFSARTTELAARRVNREGADELQLEIKIGTVYESGRMTTTHGSISLNGEEADWLVSVIAAETQRAALAAAFEAGATSVHEHWTANPGEAPRGDPEFGEAARDYAASVGREPGQ